MSRRHPDDSNIQDILEYLRKDADNFARLDERMEVLETNVNKLEHILLDGSKDQPPLIHQIMETKFNLSTLKQTVVDNERRIRESMRHKNQMVTAIIIALISAAASILSAYMAMRIQP